MTVSISANPVQITVGKKTWTFRPLSDQQFDELDAWLSNRVMAIAKATLTQDMLPPERQEIINAATETAATASFNSAIGQKILATPAGAAFLCWLHIRTDHPDETVTSVRAAMGKSRINRDVNEIITKFIEINLRDSDGELKNGDTPGKTE